MSTRKEELDGYRKQLMELTGKGVEKSEEVLAKVAELKAKIDAKEVEERENEETEEDWP